MSLLRYDSISLANTVVHEVFHNTIYLPGQAVFNESLAQFVGARGAVVYFCAVEHDPALCRTSELSWQDEMRFGAFLTGLVRQLEQLYSRPNMTSEQKIAIRERIFRESQTEYADVLAPQFRAMSFSSFIRTPLNNASLIARRIYYERLDLFEQVYQRNGKDLLVTIRKIIDAAEADPDDPYGAVERLLEE